MKNTNKYQTRSDGMHYRIAWGREIDVVDLDEGRPGTVRFRDGTEQECIAFKCGSGGTFLWLFELKDPCAYPVEREMIRVDVTLPETERNGVKLSGTVLSDLPVYGATGSYQIHSRDRFKKDMTV